MKISVVDLFLFQSTTCKQLEYCIFFEKIGCALVQKLNSLHKYTFSEILEQIDYKNSPLSKSVDTKNHNHCHYIFVSSIDIRSTFIIK